MADISFIANTLSSVTKLVRYVPYLLCAVGSFTMFLTALLYYTSGKYDRFRRNFSYDGLVIVTISETGCGTPNYAIFASGLHLTSLLTAVMFWAIHQIYVRGSKFADARGCCSTYSVLKWCSILTPIGMFLTGSISVCANVGLHGFVAGVMFICAVLYIVAFTRQVEQSHLLFCTSMNSIWTWKSKDRPPSPQPKSNLGSLLISCDKHENSKSDAICKYDKEADISEPAVVEDTKGLEIDQITAPVNVLQRFSTDANIKIRYVSARLALMALISYMIICPIIGYYLGCYDSNTSNDNDLDDARDDVSVDGSYCIVESIQCITEYLIAAAFFWFIATLQQPFQNIEIFAKSTRSR